MSIFARLDPSRAAPAATSTATAAEPPSPPIERFELDIVVVLAAVAEGALDDGEDADDAFFAVLEGVVLGAKKLVSDFCCDLPGMMRDGRYTRGRSAIYSEACWRSRIRGSCVGAMHVHGALRI